MTFLKPTVDYSGFRLNQINYEEYKHFKYWLFWPILGLRYVFVERVLTADRYFEVYHPVDDLIPFREEFIIPYAFWYLFMFGMQLYLFLHDVDGFKRYSKCLCVAMSMSTVIFILFPTCQNLRPTVYPRDNLLTDVVRILHTVDTNTNVCPSEHVIGSVAVVFAAAHTKRFKNLKSMTVFAAMAAVICLSTLFLKQHSVLDVVAALPICMIAYWIVYKGVRNNKEKEKWIA